MSGLQERQAQVGKVTGTIMLLAIFASNLLLFWVSRALTDEAYAGWIELDTRLRDLLWSHLGSSALFALVGVLAILTLWARPGRRLGFALMGMVASVLATLGFVLVLGQFNPAEASLFLFFYPVVVLLTLISSFSIIVFLVISVVASRSRRQASRTAAASPGSPPSD